MRTVLRPAYADFNPRSREGSDPIFIHQFINLVISIHAPARGATPAPYPSSSPKGYFNPRSREGSDQAVLRSFS